jgi:parallel beta-helix repeat protein
MTRRRSLRSGAGTDPSPSHLYSRVAVGLVGVTLALLSASCTSEPSVVPIGASLPPTTEPAITTATLEPGSDAQDEPDAQDNTVLLSVGQDFQDAVDAAPDGTTFAIEAGTHRLQNVRPREGMTFEGRPGAIMNGAIELTDWNLTESGLWRLDGIESTVHSRGRCIDGYEGCALSQDLFMDDVMLWQVTDDEDLGSGAWYWEDESIFVVDDPAHRRVELSVATQAFAGDASDITIRSLIIEKYAAPAQIGAVHAASPMSNDAPVGSGWLIEDLEIRLNHGAGLRVGDSTTARRLFIHHNGQLGIIASGGSDSIVEDSEIANNNIAGYNWGWEAGGTKFKRTSGLIVRGSNFHDNTGPGIWMDSNNYGTLLESNTVTDNTGPGIFEEISFDAVIRNNTVMGNGFKFQKWLWGAGILVAASTNVEVYGNTVVGNADGISGIQQDRDGGPDGKYLLSGLFVHDNTISTADGRTGLVEDIGDETVFTERGNRFESNTYVDMAGNQYSWGGKNLDPAGW